MLRTHGRYDYSNITKRPDYTWPGGKRIPEWLAGFTSNGVDATSQMWAFFREHRLHVQ